MASAKKSTKSTKSGKSASARSGGKGASKNTKTSASAKSKKAEPQQSSMPSSELIGLLIMGLAIVSIVVLLTVDSQNNFVRTFLEGLSGIFCYVTCAILLWIGLLVAFHGQRQVDHKRVSMMGVAILLVFAMVHIFYARDIMQSLILGRGWLNFVRESYFQRAGTGAIGALLSYPAFIALGQWGGLAVLIILFLLDIVIIKQISLSAVAAKAQAYVQRNYDEFHAQHMERMEERRRQREEQAAQRSREDWASWDDGTSTQPVDEGPFKAPVKRRKKGNVPLFNAGAQVEDDFPAADEEPPIVHYPDPTPEPEPTPAPEPPQDEFDPWDDSTEPEEDPVDIPEADEPVESVDEPDEPVDEDDDDDLFDGFDEEEDETPEPTPPHTSRRDEPQSPFEPVDLPPRDKRQDGTPIVLPKYENDTHDLTPTGEVYNYPPVDLLALPRPSQISNAQASDQAKAKKLEETLQSFGISATLKDIAHGPAVTRFELAPAAGVKVSRITSLADDIALNLAATSVRIEAPIPGKAAVGVEIPNDTVETVPLREVLESNEARKHPSRLAVAMGKDNGGRYIIADIAKMPHVLIAGATGSGKSVCINCIICSILYRATPDEVRLIMIDPKVVELSVYNGIPHLLQPVVTDPKKASGALHWAVAEMTDRYKRFAEKEVREIKSYNKKVTAEGGTPMPQIVIIIDELADLMMVAPNEVEDSICRLAQLARAAGIHLVIATQRPSVNVITGLIKANIPARIAFTVTSYIDSRTILDVAGAEKLLGRGDMLFSPAGANRMQRVQGAWVSDDEIVAVVEYIKSRHEPEYNSDLLNYMDNRGDDNDAPDQDDGDMEGDKLLPQALDIAITAGQVSISMLQRKLSIGYARAGRLVDEMANKGYVSQSEGTKPRNVLITREEFMLQFGAQLARNE